VASLPLHAYDRLPTAALAGKTVIDTMNYFPPRDGRIAELDDGELTSSALVQRHLAGSRVVKACNNLLPTSLFTLARPADAPDRSALPIAGDDPAAKAQVAELLDALGYDTVDVGTLADSWRFEPGSPVYLQPYLPGQPPQGASPEQYRRWAMETPSVPVPAARVRELIDSAVRCPAGVIRPISTPN
jgi:8-hydroxy-5-deazaflavin:NADPH oxidoreductase